MRIVRRRGAGRTISVQTLSLNDILAFIDTQKVDLLKIDVEGAEHEILQAATPEQLAPFERVQLEYHGPMPKERVFQPLIKAGFCCTVDIQYGANSGLAHFQRS